MSLILASKSNSRFRLLRNAGLDVNQQSSGVDENKIKNHMLKQGAGPQEIAEKLALEKALTISKTNENNIIIGADQILVCEGKMFDKARTAEQAEEHLKFLRGKTHRLITSVVLVKNGALLWSHTDEPSLTMRPFSDKFLSQYLAQAGDALYHSVGGYFLESIGVRLFSQINGDYHAILGMPLLPLLNQLRELEILDE